MSIMKKVEIDGKQVPFKASAAIPRIYRIKFNRDIYKDLRSLEKAVGDGDEQNSNLDLFSPWSKIATPPARPPQHFLPTLFRLKFTRSLINISFP